MIDMYILYKNWPQTGKIERHSAYFSEQEAREAAKDLIGKDQALIGMEIIPVKGDPMNSIKKMEKFYSSDSITSTGYDFDQFSKT